MIVLFPLGCLQPQSSNTGIETNIESQPTDLTNIEDTSSDVTEDKNEPEPIYRTEYGHSQTSHSQVKPVVFPMRQ